MLHHISAKGVKGDQSPFSKARKVNPPIFFQGLVNSIYCWSYLRKIVYVNSTLCKSNPKYLNDQQCGALLISIIKDTMYKLWDWTRRHSLEYNGESLLHAPTLHGSTSLHIIYATNTDTCSVPEVHIVFLLGICLA